MDKESLRSRLQKRLAGEPSLGADLKKARESRNIPLREISESTKIPERYFEALEKDDLSILPGGIYGKNYTRAYAECIGLDPEGVVEAYLLARGSDEQIPQAGAPVCSSVPSQPARPGLLERVRLPRQVWLFLPLALFLVGMEGWAHLNSTAEPGSDPGSGSAGDRNNRAVLADSRPSRTGQPVLASPQGRPEKGPAKTSRVAARGLSVPEFGVGSGVVEHQLRGRAGEFKEGTVVWFWNRVNGGESGERIRHVWIREGWQVASVDLVLGGSRWRTQSSKTLDSGSVGRWVVEARAQDGRVLARQRFVCRQGS